VLRPRGILCSLRGRYSTQHIVGESENFSDNLFQCFSTRSKQYDGQGSINSIQVNQNILPFYVDDSSGSVLVNATTGTVTLKSGQTETSGSKRQEEGVTQEGDQITVYGEVDRFTPGSVLPGSEGSEPDPVVTTGTEYGDVVVTNRPGRRVLAGQSHTGWAGSVSVLHLSSPQSRWLPGWCRYNRHRHGGQLGNSRANHGCPSAE
jgi:hypothetical protein